MTKRSKIKTKSIFYYPIAFFGFLFTISPLLLIKMLATLSAALTLLFLKDFWWASILAIIVFFITWGLLFPIGKYLTGRGLLLSELSRHYKKSYILEYGENYKEPSFEEFGLQSEEYYSYNRKFKLDTEFIPFLTVPITLISSFNLTSKRGFIPVLISLSIALTLYLITKYLCLFINYKIMSKNPKYRNIKEFNKSKFIYTKVQEEIKANKSAFKGWED